MKLVAPPKIGAGVRIRNLTKLYSGTAAVDGINLDIAAGEFMTLLGPSGSGKTTTMMAVAGFVEDYDGEIRIGDRVIDGLPPHRRGIGVLFQHLALFPHMSAADNVAFPLRMRGIGAAEVSRRVAAAFALVKMDGFAQRLPSQLSGGQQQRIALARALVFNPPVLLLDEPLGALDRKLRESMQIELKSLHEQLGITIIHVTHDQTEAMSVSDRIAVLNKGRIEQCGTPQELYARPVNRFVADFVGDSVFLDATVESAAADSVHLRTRGGLLCKTRHDARFSAGAAVTLMIRPERFLVADETLAADNRFDGEVRSVSFTGDRIRYDLGLTGGEQVSVVVPNRGEATIVPAGGRLPVGWNARDIVLFPQ